MKFCLILLPARWSLHCYVPETPEEMTNGLQGFARLTERQGMLFRFGLPRAVTMKMASVSFPIDVVFLKGRVVQAVIPNRVPGCDEQWSCYADEVLELAGNWCEVHGLAVGMHV